jgi:transcriptional regulator with XRE-family HTH domain
METELHPLKRYRQAMGLTLGELASQVDTHASTILRIERRETYPSARLIAFLSRATGLSPDSFLPPLPKKVRR